MSSTPYDTDRFGAALPRFSPRQSDLLMVVGTLTHKQAPILLKVYEQMCEPKWVMAFGACATSGGFYQNYAAVAGIDKIIPVDIYVPGCPPRPETVIDAIMKLQDRIAAIAASDPHRRRSDHDRARSSSACSSSSSPRTARPSLSHGMLVIVAPARRVCSAPCAGSSRSSRSTCSSTSRRSTGRSGRRASTSSITSTRRRT